MPRKMKLTRAQVEAIGGTFREPKAKTRAKAAPDPAAPEGFAASMKRQVGEGRMAAPLTFGQYCQMAEMMIGAFKDAQQKYHETVIKPFSEKLFEKNQARDAKIAALEAEVIRLGGDPKLLSEPT